MENFYMNSTSQDHGYNQSNITSSYKNDSNNPFDIEYFKKVYFILYVITWIIGCIGIPLTLVAIYALYSEVRNDHVAPIYVINLLISDLIQLCCMIVRVAPNDGRIIYVINYYIYSYGLAASVGFMVCVALERYLVIACPLWYRFRRTIKFSVLVCVVVWVIPLVDFLNLYFSVGSRIIDIIAGVFLLLPLLLLIFFLGGTLKALSTSRVPSDEKLRILGVLVLVLLIYTLLFLPRIIGFLAEGAKNNIIFISLFSVCVQSSPLADLVLYVFIRKGTTDNVCASGCCCRIDSSDVIILTGEGEGGEIEGEV